MAWATPKAMERLLETPVMSTRFSCKKPMEYQSFLFWMNG